MSKPYNSRHSWANQKQASRHHAKKLGRLIKNIALSDSVKKGRLLKNLALATLGAFFLGLFVMLGAFAFISRDLPDPNALSSRDVAQATKIYDRTGEHLLYEIYGEENRTLVKIQDGFCGDDERMELDANGIPLYALQATIAAEDHSFCTHHGFSVKGLLRAVVFRGSRGGGSTLTQQLVKNAILSNERTITRKVKELILSLALERRYTKDEILQIYFNEIPYGSTYYGIQAAAQNYFGKEVANLTLAESATLAGLPQLPTYYVNNPDKLQVRRDWILDNMVEQGFITEEEANEAKAVTVELRPRVANISAPHYVLWVKEQLETEYGQRVVEQGGLKVITSIDYDLQAKAEAAVIKNRDSRGESYGFNNSGLIAMDPKTGQILAMVGSADYFNDEIDGQVNVTLRPLQPGSSIKPIIYAAGFERGYTPNTLLWDTLTAFPTATGPYQPNNYDGKEHGSVTIRKALQGSLNIPAVKMLYLVGVENGLDFAERLGYTTFENRSDFGLAIVLGGAEVKLIDHVGAYAVFANEGVKHDPISILKVEEPGGNVVFEWKEDEGQNVLDANIARTVSNVLSDDASRAYAFGANGLLTLPGRPVAAKTGTTNDYKDAWAMGYTPTLVAGVWTGNTDGTKMNRGAGGSTVAAPIWNDFMRAALSGTAVESFTAPNIPTTGKAVLDGKLVSQTVTIDRFTGKLATDRTPKRFREERVCGEYHTILAYVDKNDPLGPVPENPKKDPAYEAWETGVQAYLAKERGVEGESSTPIIGSCEIPTESDDVHAPENDPTLSIREPKRNDDVPRQFTVRLNAEAPRGISRVEYLIDGSLVHIDQNSSGTTLRLPSWVKRGDHTLTVNVYDDVDNMASDRVLIHVSADGGSDGLSITNPFNNQVIERTSEPYQLSVEASDTYRTLSVSARNLWTGGTHLILETTSPSSINTVSWTLPESAEYILNAQATTASGDNIDASPIRIQITDPAPVAPEDPVDPTILDVLEEFAQPE